MNQPRRIAFFAGVLGAALMGGATAQGSTLRHDVDPQLYEDYGDGFKLVGGVRNGLTSFGSGVVIHPEWVLTAAHVVASPDMIFGIGFETDPDPAEPPDDWGLQYSGIFSVTEVAIHEYYDDNLGPAGGFDIALLHLDRPVTQFTPWNRFQGSGTLELGRQGTAAGFGATGTGLTGYDANTGGFLRLAVDSMIDGLGSDPRVVGEFVSRDVVDPVTGQPVHFTARQIADQFMLSDFDAPPGSGDFANPLGSATPLPLEGSVAPGDSGGPLFINGRVAGINSWIYGLPAPDGDGTDDASYGDLSGYLRVSLFNDWIDGVIGVPEPASAGVWMLVFSGMILRRRRTKMDAADL